MSPQIQSALAAVAVLGFMSGVAGLGFTLWSRGSASGVQHANATQSNEIQKQIAAGIQQQAVALAQQGEGMEHLGDGIQEAITLMRESIQAQHEAAEAQRRTNENFVAEIRTHGDRLRALEESRQKGAA